MKNYIKETVDLKAGAEVILKGWVHVYRRMGKLGFIDLRDSTGIIQVVCVPDEMTQGADILDDVRSEFVVSIKGVIQERGVKQQREDQLTGKIEILAKELEILSESETPPFEIVNEERQANEELRLKYRYLDLRHERMAKNMNLRHQVIKNFREQFYALDFKEIETPYLSKSTPEGARDFLVPSRNYPGKFYALPQSPQQYKQMLMVAGLEKYFQVVRCFRDEDQRGDRQAEFTQIDVERSFVDQEEIINMLEAIMIKMVEVVAPDKKIMSVPFPRLTYKEAMEKYQSDKPDLRKNKEDKDELAFAWVVDFPMFEYKEGDERWGAVHHPFTAFDQADLAKVEAGDLGEIKAKQYDLVLNGSEIAGGSIRTHSAEILAKVFKALGHSEEEVQSQFGHLLEAFKYGVPPHGGIAIGLDRLLMILAGEDSIREVMAFPKTSDNRDPLMDSPSDVSKAQLDELHLSLKK
ncbi:aspartate--tRNA ligase [Candidatus Nomurabacteria bacterium]|nr:aspartate--tRNA ligase [Candidatus Nomurabacteria bacterium]